MFFGNFKNILENCLKKYSKMTVKSPFSKKFKRKKFFDINGVFKPFTWLFTFVKNQKTECIDFCTKKVFEKC